MARLTRVLPITTLLALACASPPPPPSDDPVCTDCETDVPTPVAPSHVSVFRNSACAFDPNHGMRCWGGEIRYGSTPEQNDIAQPTPWLEVPEVEGLRGVVVGEELLAVNEVGEAIGWSSMDWRMVDALAGLEVVALGGSYDACALTADGRVWRYGQMVPFPEGAWVRLSCGVLGTVCAVEPSGRYACQGETTPWAGLPRGLSWQTVEVSGSWVCGITTGGELHCAWSEEFWALVAPTGSDFVEVRVDRGTGCALREDGTIACFGGASGFGIPATLEGEVYVALDFFQGTLCAVTDAGEVRCWGSDEYGEGIPPGP